MRWNKKAQTWAYGLMIGITLIVLALALIFPVKESVDIAKNTSHIGVLGEEVTGMNCSTTTDNFVKATCIVSDISPFYFFGSLLFIAGAIIVAKVVLQ